MINNNHLDLIPVKAVFFDYGATLDTDGIHWAHVIEQGYEAAQIPLSHQDFLDVYVYGERYLARHVVINEGDNFKVLLEKKIQIHFDYLKQTASCTLTSDHLKIVVDYCDQFAQKKTQAAKSVLSYLKQKYTLVLVSNFYGNLRAVLESYGLLNYFNDIIESAVVGLRKPSPSIYQLAVDRSGLVPSEVVVVGDSFKKDVLPARQVGCQTIWLKGKGWSDDQEQFNNFAIEIGSIQDLIKLFS